MEKSYLHLITLNSH